MKARYREPYNAQHSSVSWNLMIDKNPLWATRQHGHSVQTMLEVYAAWTEDAQAADIETIKQTMEGSRSAEQTSVENAAVMFPSPPEIGHQYATRQEECSLKPLKNKEK